MDDITQQFRAVWRLVVVDQAGIVVSTELLPGQQALILGKNICEVLPWFHLAWLNKPQRSRVVEGSGHYRFLLEIYPHNGVYKLLWRNVADYRVVEQLCCEVTDDTISIQKFIDGFYDGIFISDVRGKVLVVNDAWCLIAGIAKDEVLGKNLSWLVEQGLIPFSATMRAITNQAQYSTTLQYPRGRKALVTSTPLYNNEGQMIRVLSNVRDLSELNILQQKIQHITARSERLQHELKAVQEIKNNPHLSLTSSAVMEHLYALVIKVANTDLQLLITGCSGVGKTALAKLVHSLSDRSNQGNFIHINCSAIPDSLLESELFGYEPGAFTGAVKGKIGLFELADKGTIFLDEIGDMSLALQAKILNALQEKSFYRVGGRKPIEVDARVIAATNVDLAQLIKTGKFREDLYYRLNVVPLIIPRLAERREDIPRLITYYLECCNRRHGKVKTCSPSVMAAFIRYEWPGNIREIINLIERLVVTVDDDIIDIYHLPSIMQTEAAAKTYNDTMGLWNQNLSLRQAIKALETKIVEEAIVECGSYKAAAQALNIDVATLFRKRKQCQAYKIL